MTASWNSWHCGSKSSRPYSQLAWVGHVKGATLAGSEPKVPEQTPEGDYPLFVGGADVYAAVLAQSSPELFDISSVDDAVATLNKIGSLPETAGYATLAIPNQGLAVGRSRLNDLPSSRAAMLLTPSTQSVAPVATLVNVRQKTERVVQGQAQLVVNVRKPYRGVTATEDE